MGIFEEIQCGDAQGGRIDWASSLGSLLIRGVREHVI
jgi:hypothetical protein